jgi:mRNA interferase YafQ
MMRTIEYTKKFKKDYKRESNGHHGRTLKQDLEKITTVLANDKSLAIKYRDHALSGDWKDHRDCHIKPDLVLIYRKHDKNRLQLVRLGSHSEISL